MAQKTLLEVVQTYLTYIDGFEVDSIYDSVEARQAAQICLHVLDTVLDKDRDLQYKTVIRTLDTIGDNTKPTLMRIPQEVMRIHDSLVYYNTAETGVLFEPVQYVDPKYFLDITNSVPSTLENAEVITVNGAQIVVLNNRHPLHFTTFDDQILVFDSYNKNVDTVLQPSKTKVISSEKTEFVLSDNFVIPLPERMLSGYVDTCINECIVALRATQNPVVARRANQFLSKIQQSQKRVGNKYSSAKRYGRR